MIFQRGYKISHQNWTFNHLPFELEHTLYIKLVVVSSIIKLKQ